MDNQDVIGVEVTEELFDQYEKFLQTELLGTADSIKESAQMLINYAEELKGLHAAQRGLYKRLSSITENNGLSVVFEFSKKLITTKEEYKKIMNLVLRLQNEVQKFLGQKLQMIMVWMDSDGSIELYQTENDLEHMNIGRMAKSRGGSIVGRYTKNLRKGIRVAIDGYDPDKSGLNSTFKEVYQRAQLSKQTISAGGKIWIFWNPPDWQGVQVSGFGVLGEAYGAFYFAEEIFQAALEENVGHFMLGSNGENGALGVDSKSGFLEGDSSSKDGVIQYGFKMNKASAMGYSDIIQYAYEILQTTDIKEYLEELRKKLDADKKPLAKKVDNCFDNTYTKLLKAIENRSK